MEPKPKPYLSPVETVISNEYLLSEILLRLPPRILLELKLVSKHFYSLISHPNFRLSHHNRHPPSALVTQHDGDEQPGPSSRRNAEIRIVLLAGPLPAPAAETLLPRIEIDTTLWIEQCCKGLFLCSNDLMAMLSYADHHRYYVCNPATRKLRKLEFPSPEFLSSLVGLTLAFDPIKSPHYKLVSLRKIASLMDYQIGLQNRFLVDLYSSETCSWTLMDLVLEAPHPFRFYDSVYLNGVVHWFGEDYENTMVYLDLETLCLRTISLPSKAHGLTLKFFGESENHLHSVFYHDSFRGFDVFEMKEDYSEWFVRFRVDLASLGAELPFVEGRDHHICQDFRILEIVRTGEAEGYVVMLFVHDNTTFAYDLTHGTSKKLCKLDICCPRVHSRWCFQYFETLVRV